MAGLALEESEINAVKQTKHDEMSVERRSSELEYDPKPASPQVLEVKLSCHTPYNIDIDDLDHDDHVQDWFAEHSFHAKHVQEKDVDGGLNVDVFYKNRFVLKPEKWFHRPAQFDIASVTKAVKKQQSVITLLSYLAVTHFLTTFQHVYPNIFIVTV